MHQIKKSNRVTLSLVRLSVLVALVVILVPGSIAAAQRGAAAAEVLTNQSVIGMVAAKLNQDVLSAKISSTRNSFDVTVNGLVNLYQNKVPTAVMQSMISMAGDAKLGQPASRTPEVLNNQSIVTLVVGKVPKAVILSKIQNTKSDFDVSSDGLVELTQAKVPTDVIKVMISKAH
jgi:hypothetical protein